MSDTPDHICHHHTSGCCICQAVPCRDGLQLLLRELAHLRQELKGTILFEEERRRRESIEYSKTEWMNDDTVEQQRPD